jgi:hypothetical protein
MNARKFRNLIFLWINGDGTFGPAVEIDSMEQVGGIATGDFNGDGQLDLVTVPYECGCSDAVVWLNACGAAGPRLNYTRNGIYFSNSWPSPASEYTVEFSTSLTAPRWAAMPPDHNGGWKVTTLISGTEALRETPFAARFSGNHPFKESKC